jgi:flavin-dependent dehydrogenase
MTQTTGITHSMASAAYDLLIIGAGPAGSCAAALARKKNLRTLVVDKAAFPRFRIGESLLPMGNAILRETGAWEKIEAGGFMPKYGAEFHTSDGFSVKKVDFSTSLVPGLERTYQVERARFDALLLDHAKELGAEVRLETAVRSLETRGAQHHVTLERAGGQETISVPWVIDSTGRESSFSIPQKTQLDPSPFPKRVAIYSHFENVVRARGKEGGNILIVRLKEGWFWLIPLDAKRTSVGLVTTVEAFRQAQDAPGAYFSRAIRNSPKLRELLDRAVPMIPFQVTSDYSYFRKNLAAERLLLAGDAAGFFDPIFSSGVYMACLSAKNAVELVARAHAENRGLTASERNRYTKTIKRHAGVFQKLIAAFYDDDAFEVFLCQKVPWDLSPGITSIVAGHAKMIWPLWWRFQIFLIVCRLQRYWKIVKPESPPLTQVVRA